MAECGNFCQFADKIFVVCETVNIRIWYRAENLTYGNDLVIRSLLSVSAAGILGFLKNVWRN